MQEKLKLPPFCPSKNSLAVKSEVTLVIPRSEIELGIPFIAAAKLRYLSEDKLTALSAANALSISILGYEDELAPISSIKEVRTFFRRLHSVWPYWSFFLNTQDESIPFVLSALLPGRMIFHDVSGKQGWQTNFADLYNLAGELISHHRAMTAKLEIQTELSDVIVKEFLEATLSSFDGDLTS